MARKLDQTQAEFLGTQFRLARQSRALSIQEAASQCGMHHSQLSRLERGQFKRLSGNVQILCSNLHIKPHELMADSTGVAQLHARLDALVGRDPRNAKILAALLDVLDTLQPAA